MNLRASPKDHMQQKESLGGATAKMLTKEPESKKGEVI